MTRPTTPSDGAVRGLGAYMKDIACKLRVSDPMLPDEASTYAIGVSADLPYCVMVLLRLEAREIAKRKKHYIEQGFVRGPRWLDAARYYGWDA